MGLTLRTFRFAIAVQTITALLTCPLLCGPGDAACLSAAADCQEAGDEPCGPHPADPCDQPGDGCICQGATIAISAKPGKGLQWPYEPADGHDGTRCSAAVTDARVQTFLHRHDSPSALSRPIRTLIHSYLI